MMLTGMHVAIIGGDARQLEVIRKLVELDAKLSLVGFDQLAHHFTGAVKLPSMKSILPTWMRSFCRSTVRRWTET